MTRYSARQLKEGAVCFPGAFDFDERPEGVSPRRLPAWTRPQIPQVMDAMLRMPSGVRMTFRTDAREIRLFVQTTRLVTPPQLPRPVVFDLVVNGAQPVSFSSDQGNTILLDRKNPTKFELVRGAAYEVVFSELSPGENSCELWLPHNAYVEIRALDVEGTSTVSPISIPTTRRWIHYGSSISHCMEAAQPTGTWPAVAARLAQVNLQSLGFGGQCVLDPFVARTIRDAEADFISIKTGINIINGDFMRERVFAPVLHGFLDTIREGKATTPILLVSPIFCPSAEHRPGPTIPNASGKFVTLTGHEVIQNGCMTLTRVRELIQEVVAVRQREGDTNLHYLSGLQLFGEADAADLPDDLHPNPVGYARMGERFAKAAFSDSGLNLLR
jgi:GDSL-like Lipase/Acylhydrolase family